MTGHNVLRMILGGRLACQASKLEMRILIQGCLRCFVLAGLSGDVRVTGCRGWTHGSHGVSSGFEPGVDAAQGR